MVTGQCSWQYWVHCNRYWAVSFTLCPTNNWYWYYRKRVCFSMSYFKIGHISGVQILFTRGHKDQLHCNFSNFFFRFTLEDWNIIVAPRNRRNPVEQVDSFFEGLAVRKFVAVVLSNCHDEPVIGVIMKI